MNLHRARVTFALFCCFAFMKIQFLGTAAAEGVPAMFCDCESCKNIRLLGGRELRTRTQVLIDGDLSVDFPPEAYVHSIKYGFNLAGLKYIFVTHSHMDHFYAHDFILRGYRYASGFGSPLQIYGNKEVAAVFSECTRREMKPSVAPNVVMNEIMPYRRYLIGRYRLLTLPANHSLTEDALLFYIERGGRGYLHLHDTALPEEGIYGYLSENGAKASLVSLDCTYAGRTGITRPRHMNIDDCALVISKLKAAGVCGADTKFVITHFSHNSNPLTSRLALLEEQYGVVAAYDGLQFDI